MTHSELDTLISMIKNAPSIPENARGILLQQAKKVRGTANTNTHTYTPGEWVHYGDQDNQFVVLSHDATTGTLNLYDPETTNCETCQPHHVRHINDKKPVRFTSHVPAKLDVKIFTSFNDYDTAPTGTIVRAPEVIAGKYRKNGHVWHLLDDQLDAVPNQWLSNEEISARGCRVVIYEPRNTL